MSDRSSQGDAPESTPRRLSGNAIGAIFMILSGVGFTLYTVLAKELSEDVHPVFLAFWRSFFALFFSVPLILRSGLSSMKTTKPGLVFVRSLFGTLGFTLAMVAVSDFFTMSLSQFNAISFSRPLFVTILAALLLKESVGAHRWGAVGIGFFGVMIMVLPGVFMFWDPDAQSKLSLDLGTLCAFGSAFSLAFAIVSVKRLSQELSAVALLTYANLLSTILLLPFAFIFWSAPSLETWGWIFFMAFTGFVSQFCYISAVSYGEASFISPLDYLRLPMATVADLIVVGLLPGMNVWIGAGVIVASAAYITWRDRKKSTHKTDLPHDTG